MVNSDLKTSARMAIGMGFFLPVAETIRRIHQIFIAREFFSWFDDYLLGILLLVGAFRALQHKKNAVAYLIAVWGIATGALLLSFLGQFRYYETKSGDPGIFSTTFVAVAKGIILLYMVVGLRKSIKARDQVSQ